jgi:hypothetical protein
MTRRVLSIHEKGIEDLGDLLAIARAEGKKAFRTKSRWSMTESMQPTIPRRGIN